MLLSRSSATFNSIISRSLANTGCANQSWGIIEEVHFQDKFYVLDYFGKLFSFDITTQSISNVNLVAQRVHRICGYNHKTYLMVSNEKKNIDGSKVLSVWPQTHHKEI
ncbi:unnamed protein product [Prunus brigantina]